MPTYRVVRGTHRREDGTVAEVGDTVEMTEDVRNNFPREKFREIETVEVPADDTTTTATDTESDPNNVVPDAEVTEDVAPSPDEVEDTEASGDVPDDYNLLSKMAKHYDGDEVHGSMGTDELTEFFSELSDTEIAHLKDEARDEVN